jgi:hypothetical protein
MTDQGIAVTTDTILLNYLLPCFLYKNYLRFVPQGKNCSMSKSVLRLEIVLVKYIVMRNMTIVAISNLTV